MSGTEEKVWAWEAHRPKLERYARSARSFQVVELVAIGQVLADEAEALSTEVEKLREENTVLKTRSENAARELERARAKIVRQGAAIDYMLSLVNPAVAQQVRKEIGE